MSLKNLALVLLLTSFSIIAQYKFCGHVDNKKGQNNVSNLLLRKKC